MKTVHHGKRQKVYGPGEELDLDHDKAYYTHFLIKGNKVAFVLTPHGGGWGSVSSEAASYYIADFKSGAILSRGSYAYPRDSMVFYRDGRILACVVNGDGDMSIAEVTLPGL